MGLKAEVIMDGVIIFASTAELAEFLKEFCGCTAKFTVSKDPHFWVLKFDGGF